MLFLGSKGGGIELIINNQSHTENGILGGGMKFNHEDLVKGNISYEQTLSIINYVVYNRIKSELDNSFYKEEDLKVVANWLLETARGTIIFKTSVDPSQDGDKRTFNEKLTANKKALLIQQFFIIQRLMEHYKVIENLQAKFNSQLERLRELKGKEHEEYLRQLDYENKRISERIEMEIQKMKEDVRAYVESLHKSIGAREGLILASRKFHADNIIAQAGNIIVNGKKFFEGCDKKQIEAFVDGRLAIMEFKERRKLELEFERDLALERNKSMPIHQTNGGLFTQSHKAGADAGILSNFESKLLKLEREEIDNLRRLVKETGMLSIDANANDKEFMSQVAAYDDNPIVKAEQTKHIELVLQEGWQIIRENQLANKAEASYGVMLNSKDRKVKIKVADELLQQVHQSAITNDSVLLLNKENEIDLIKDVKSDSLLEVSKASNHMASSNPDLRDILDKEDDISVSRSAIQDDNEIQKQISDSIIDGLDFEGFDIDLGDEYVALESMVDEVGAASISNLESMDEIDFYKLRASSEVENVIENEARSKKTRSI